MPRVITKTLRISQEDTDIINKFQELNPVFENFSTLVRVAILDFISKRGVIPIKPVMTEQPRVRPTFLWDYDLTEAEIREILAGPRENARWLIARILEHARFGEVWDYLTLEVVEKELPSLRLPPKVHEHWRYAMERWRKKK